MRRGALGLVLVASTALAGPTLVPSPPADLGGPTANEIHLAIKAQSPAFQACHQKAAAKQPALGVKFVYKITIGTDGAVRHVVPTAPTKQSKLLDTCIVRVIKRVKFPARGVTVVVMYPLVFTKTS